MKRTITLGIAVISIIVVIDAASIVLILNNKDSTISDLNNQVSNLQSKAALDNSTIGLLNSQVANLQSQISNLQTQISTLQSQLNSTGSQNSNLQSQLNALNSSYNTLSAEYSKLQNDYLGMLGVKNDTYLAYYDGVAVLNYSWSGNVMSGLTRYHSATMEIYNLQSACSIDVKLYSPTLGTSKVFTYTMPSGYKKFVETWDTGFSDAYYPNITIQNVRR